MILKNKTVLITGASEGIGKETALSLSNEGCNLALIARSKDNLDAVKKACIEAGALKVGVYPTDIQKTNDLAISVEKIANDFGSMDILINNAGIWQKKKQIEDVKEEAVDSVINTNLTALIHITRLVIPHLKKAKEGAIINISSKSGVTSQEGQSVYTASKYGVRGFTDVLKADLKGTNVRVAGIYQSGTNTQMFAKTGEKVPNEKFTEPKDLADVITFMLSRPKKIWLDDVRIGY